MLIIYISPRIDQRRMNLVKINSNYNIKGLRVSAYLPSKGMKLGDQGPQLGHVLAEMKDLTNWNIASKLAKSYG